MPFILGLIGLFAPRLTMFFIWLLTNWFDKVFTTSIWPFLGWIFLPFTTLAYLFCHLAGFGEIATLIFVIFGFALDCSSPVAIHSND